MPSSREGGGGGSEIGSLEGLKFEEQAFEEQRSS